MTKYLSPSACFRSGVNNTLGLVLCHILEAGEAGDGDVVFEYMYDIQCPSHSHMSLYIKWHINNNFSPQHIQYIH